jgi:hypothetical protein
MKLWAFFILVLFIVGCNGTNSGEQILEYNFKQGISEVEISLLDGTPPDEIYPESEFVLVVELHNQAAYDIDEGVLQIVGLDEKYFRMDILEEEVDTLLAKSLTNPEGDRDFFEFAGSSGQLFGNSEKEEANYFITLEYRSAVSFSDTICVAPGLYDVYDAGCEVDTSRSYSGQGAPLAIKKLEQITSPNSGVEFRFDIRNKGGGSVKDITLGPARLGTEELPCVFQGIAAQGRTVTLPHDEQEVTLVCRKDFLGGDSSYTTTLAVDLAYTYELREEHILKMIK